jgi:catechol-2,3-dioxygenase
MFRHVGIVVNDIDKMLNFYSTILELDIISDEIESGKFLNKIIGYENIYGRIIKLGKDNKTIVELLDFNQKEDSSEKTLIKKGITHFAITVNNIDLLYKKLIKNQLMTISDPQISNNEKFKVIFCKDPENNFIEIVEIL